MPLIKILNVSFILAVKNDGAPQPYSKLSSHLRKPIRSIEHQGPDEWSKHLEDLKNLSVLAHQATEYAYNKHKTDSKTGAIKPDLIPQEKRAAESKKLKESPKKAESPKKSQVDGKASENKELFKISSPEKSKISKDTDKFIKTEQLATPVKQTTMTTTAKPSSASTTSTVAPVNIQSSSTNTQQSPSKSRAKPTEIKKPAAVDTGRFKAAKISDAVTTSTDTSQTPSELEKIASKVAERSKSKSPTPKVNEKLEIKSSTTEANETITSSNTEKEKTKTTTPQKANIISTTSPAPASAITTGGSIIDKAGLNTAPSTSAAAAAAVTVPSATSVVKDNAKRPSLKRHKDSLTECKPLNVLVYAETSTARESAVNTLKEILADNT